MAAMVPLALSLLGNSAYSEQHEDDAELALYNYKQLVREFDLRRRVHVLFPNPQTLFDGLQAGFVNVGAGNLTFVRRDLVTRANGPLVFGRVYDSRLAEDGDFGPGWRLSLSEELHIGEASVAYVDGSGSRRLFVPGGDGYRPERPTPRHAATRIVLGSEEATMWHADGAKRTFKPVASGGPWRITRIETGERKLDFRYRSGKLNAVFHGGRWMFLLRRDAAGRIAAVSDNHGRTVRYAYAGEDRLKDVHDVAGNLWRHEYDAEGRLTAAIGANDQPYLEARYDGSGRVLESRTGRAYAFDYEWRRTVVTEGAGQRHVFEQDADGATVAFSSTTGAQWRVLLNADRRVERLTLPSRMIDYHYDAYGRVRTVEDSTHGQRERFHDDQGRLVSVRSFDGEELFAADYGGKSVRIREGGLRFGYDLTRSGQVAAAWDGAVRVVAEYDANGDLAAVCSNGRTVRFQRDQLGRVVATTQPSGFRSRYGYDLLGNRQLVEFDGGASVVYSHDPAGNIVGVEITDKDGAKRRQTATIGRMNRVERVAYDPGWALDVDYDGMGRPTTFDNGRQRVAVEYEANGRPSRLRALDTGESLELRRRRPPGGRSIAVRRRATFSRDLLGDPHPDYGPVRFAATTFDAIPLDEESQGAPHFAAAGVPHFTAARDLRSFALPLFGSEPYTIPPFEKPSNPLFQPAEYRSTNSCVVDDRGSCDPRGPLGRPVERSTTLR